MKKLITILVAIATLSVCSVSESNAQFSAGLRLGFNASKYTGDGGSQSRFVPGLHIGPYFRMAFKEKYRVQVDVLFSTKGTVVKDTIDYTNNTVQKDYYVPFYIDVPVMFNYKPIAGLYVEAGVQPSIALTQLTFSANTESKFTSPSASSLRPFIVAPIVGVGYEFKKVSLGMRATFSGSNINSSSYTYVVNGIKYTTPNTNINHNLTLMATFGFKF